MTAFKVPFIDLRQRYEEEKSELLSCVEQVLSTGDFIGGPAVGDFERAVVSYTGARHCVALNSGTDALMMGMMAMGISKGDEVITPPNSFVASTASIMHIGATPVFADVGDDQNLDPADVARKIGPKTKAIMPVHWTGRIAPMKPLMRLAEENGLQIIEDSAQSMGASYHGRHGGTFGRVGCFSAHPLKNLNALGDGGFLVTQDAEIAERLRRYRNHGLADRDTWLEIGVNSRLDTLHAEVMLYRLKRLDEVISLRRRNANLYRELIKTDAVYIPADQDWEENAYVMFIVQAERRDALHAFLVEQGVQSLVYYRNPLHLQPATSKLGYKRGDLPNAERQSELVLALPHHQCLASDQIAYAADAVNRFYRQ